jgi:predicted nuclease of predicted toxin-antitoxin system
MLRLIVDDNLRGAVRRALQHRIGNVDLIDLQSLGLTGADDATVLGVAAAHRRILIADDAQGVARIALERVDAGLPMPGVILITLDAHRGDVVDELLLLVESYHQDELAGQVIYLPLTPEPDTDDDPDREKRPAAARSARPTPPVSRACR